MSLMQWVLVIAAGIAGYVGVSWLIDRSRAARSPTPVTPGRLPQSPAPPAAQSEAPQPLRADAERSAWDEFNRR